MITGLQSVLWVLLFLSFSCSTEDKKDKAPLQKPPIQEEKQNRNETDAGTENREEAKHATEVSFAIVSKEIFENEAYGPCSRCHTGERASWPYLDSQEKLTESISFYSLSGEKELRQIILDSVTPKDGQGPYMPFGSNQNVSKQHLDLLKNWVDSTKMSVAN